MTEPETLADRLYTAWEEKAERELACVNAMQGIADPAAFVAAFDAMQEALGKIRVLAEPGTVFRHDAEAALTAARIARGGA